MTDTLFGHLVTRFAPHPENLATDALGYILSRSSVAAEAVRELALHLGSTIPAGIIYETQAGGDDGARPDLVGCAGDVTAVVVEVKFWAGLTDNQPVQYLGRLAVNGGLLLFVAPAARLSILWHELARRCQMAKLPFTERIAALKGAFVADVGSNQKIALVSWSAVLDLMQSRLLLADDRQAVGDVAQLRGLCDRMDSEAFLPVSIEELTTHTYRRVIQFGSIVEKVAERLAQKGVVSKKRLRPQAGNGFSGRYLWMNGTGVFLVCDLRKWTKFASTPLWLSIYGRKFKEKEPVLKLLAPLAAEVPKRLFIAGDGFPTVPLYVTPGREEAEIIDEIVAQIEDIAKLLLPISAPAPEEPGEPPVEPPPQE